MGIDDQSHKIILIDFDTAASYKDSITEQHIQLSENNKPTGDLNFISISSHLGSSQSRRDDLESLCYILFYFLNGTLPWMVSSEENADNRLVEIGNQKMEVVLQETFTDVPYCFF